MKSRVYFVNNISVWGSPPQIILGVRLYGAFIFRGLMLATAVLVRGLCGGASLILGWVCDCSGVGIGFSSWGVCGVVAPWICGRGRVVWGGRRGCFGCASGVFVLVGWELQFYRVLRFSYGFLVSWVLGCLTTSEETCIYHVYY